VKRPRPEITWVVATLVGDRSDVRLLDTST